LTPALGSAVKVGVDVTVGVFVIVLVIVLVAVAVGEFVAVGVLGQPAASISTASMVKSAEPLV